MPTKYEWRTRWKELVPVKQGTSTKSESRMSVILLESDGKDVLREMYQKGFLTHSALSDAEEVFGERTDG